MQIFGLQSLVVRVVHTLCKALILDKFWAAHTRTKIVPSAEVEAGGLMNLMGPSSGSSICDVAKDINAPKKFNTVFQFKQDFTFPKMKE